MRAVNKAETSPAAHPVRWVVMGARSYLSPDWTRRCASRPFSLNFSRIHDGTGLLSCQQPAVPTNDTHVTLGEATA